MADPKGFLTTNRELPKRRPVDVRIKDWKEVYQEQEFSHLQKQAGRCMDCGIPFCHQGCPLGNLIPEWNELIWRGEKVEAIDRLHATNNFPEFTGRLCPAPCETACVVAINAEAVTIKQVELRTIEEAFLEKRVVPLIPDRLSGKTVAVIGSGPAGLAAAQQLTRAGHTVAVYERADKIGGLLRYGIPEFKMEKAIVDRRLYQMEQEGTRFRTGVEVGKDISGRPVFLNISTTPHLLIAGATGAGKSSVINCIITSVLMRATPDQVKLILVDPKQVEMAQYSRLPHLLTAPVTNPKKAANALGWAVKEMERRYDVLVEAGFRDVAGYNAAYDRGEMSPQEGQETDKQFSRIPYILIVVDELNDLMMVAARDVEDCITRIAQKARAVGIHLVVATQRPSVNVITGVIKANIPARMAFAVSSLTDSRVILDQPGAEKLVGMGDMLMLPGNTSVSQRLQSAWVSENEVRKVVGHWRRQAPEVTYVSGIEGDANKTSGGGEVFGGSSGDEDDDELMRQAMDLVVRTQQGSTSMLQRKLKVGFARAGRLMDMLEQRGVVAPSEGSRPREVLMTVEELEIIQKAS